MQSRLEKLVSKQMLHNLVKTLFVLDKDALNSVSQKLEDLNTLTRCKRLKSMKFFG